MQFMQSLVFACVIAAAVSVPVAPAGDVVPPSPTPAATCSFLNTSAACNDNTCCNWCGLTINATIGWCMPLIPIPPTPALQCAKTPATCKTVFTEADCYFQDECKWVPFGPPGTAAGMCVYDWDRCKTTPTAPVAEKKAPTKEAARTHIASKTEKKQKALAVDPTPVPPAPTPKPKLTCNMTDVASCDHSICCQWCQPPFTPSTVAGFCMPVTNVPIPALTCDKGVIGCEKIFIAESCTSNALCTWLPVGPPGTGKGKCIFDWNKCIVGDDQ